MSGLFALGCDQDDGHDVSASLSRARYLEVDGSAGDAPLLGPQGIPGRLAVPVFPFDGDGFSRVQLQLIRFGVSTLATAFTTGELLVERLGKCQPWLGVPGASLVRLVNASSLAGLVIDPAPAVVEAVWTKEALVALRKVNDARF